MEDLINYGEEIVLDYSTLFTFDYFITLVLLFFTYSFLGWLMESVGSIYKQGKFVDRGFLIGPVCPIYGIGVILITLTLYRYSNKYISLFILSTVLCGIVEYFTSYIMEKLFKARWWDYSNRKYNINGRVCLENLCAFGLAGCIILCLINPILINLYGLLSNFVKKIVAFILLGLFMVDIIISFVIIKKFKNMTYKNKDNTEEISEKVKDELEKSAEELKKNTEEFRRTLSIKRSEFTENIRYKREVYNAKRLQDFNEFKKKISNTREDIEEQIRLTLDEFDYRRGKLSDDLLKRKEQFDRAVEEFKKKSILNRRIINAFPNLKLSEIPKRKHKNNK